MKTILQLIAALVVMNILVSCATTESIDEKPQVPQATKKHTLFDAWGEVSINNAAVAKLIKQADIMMKYKQWDDAQGKLERTLRVATSYAPAWSRLSWLSLRAAKHNKAIQLAHRSNSYTNSRELQILNWSFIRDANKLMGKNKEVNAAINILEKLQKMNANPAGVTR